jgi:phage protein, HK97 gp10 family
MTTEVQIHGLRELREALLRKIPAEMQGKVLQQALSAGAAIIAKEAKSRAPQKTGRMKKAIYHGRRKQSATKTFEERVVAVRRGKKLQKSGRDAFYWKFVEFGHRTGAGKGQYLKKTDGRTSHGGAVDATGFVPPQPFMRPAFEAGKHKAVTAIKTRLGTAIDKAAQKARWQTPRK